MSRAVMQQALEALEAANDCPVWPNTLKQAAQIPEAITALRAALEAQQEPALRFIQIGDTSTPANRLATVIARGLGSDHPAMKDLVELVFAKGDHPPAQPQGWVLVPARLLQKAADVLEEATTYTGSESWSPSMTDELLALRQEMLAARPQPKEPQA